MASKTDVSSAPWSSTPSLQRSYQLGRVQGEEQLRSGPKSPCDWLPHLCRVALQAVRAERYEQHVWRVSLDGGKGALPQ